MNNLILLDNFTKDLIEKVDSNILVKWAHAGFSSYIRKSIELIKHDIHLFEENNSEYVDKTYSKDILEKTSAVLSDVKNLILLKPFNREVFLFLKEYLVLISNWNQIGNDESINENLIAVLRLFEIQETFEGLLLQAKSIIHVLDEKGQEYRDRNNSYTFSTSATYLSAIKESLDKNKTIKTED